MIVERNIIAILLETRPDKIEKIEQTEHQIYIQLKDSQDKLSMTVQEYQNCLQQLKSHSSKIDCQNLITIATIFGFFIMATVSAINANVANYEHLDSNNVELTADYNQK